MRCVNRLRREVKRRICGRKRSHAVRPRKAYSYRCSLAESDCVQSSEPILNLLFICNTCAWTYNPSSTYRLCEVSMATYQSVQRQIAELQKKAEVLRKAEAAKVIAGIKAQIAKFSLTPSDLFDAGVAQAPAAPVVTKPLKASPATKAVTKKATKPAPKYMDPVSKKTWSGFGKAPAWIKIGKREDYLIGKEKPVTAPKVKVAVKKAVAAVKPAAKPVASQPAKKAVPVPKVVSKPVAKTPDPVAKAKPAPAAKPAPVLKTKAVSAAKPTVVAKAKAVSTPADKTAAAKKTPSAKRPAVSPQKPLPAEKVADVEMPVAVPAPVAAPASETGAAE